MKRIFTILFALSLGAICSAQIRMSVEDGGKPVGTAAITQQTKADGSKTVELKIEWTSGSNKLTIRSQNTYDRNGLPTRKFMESIIPGGKLQRQLIASFAADGASVVVLDGEKRQTKKVPLVSSAPRANLSEFWFLRDQPKTGQRVECYVLNLDTLAWDLQTMTYKGPRTINVKGKRITVHEVETTGNRKVVALLDDKGLPWLIETGPITMKRISEN